MRTIMMSLVLAAMSGCATTSGGVNTTFYRVNADDCGQTAPVPNNIQMFKGQLASPGTALATDEQMPPKNSLQNGKYRVMVPDPASKCAGIWVFDLTEVKVSDPAAVGGKMHRFDAVKVPISRWSE